MAVTYKDREYFQRIGAAKRASKAESAAAHSALSMDERLRRSASLYRQFRHDAHPRTDDPSPFYDRARALGLYRA